MQSFLRRRHYVSAKSTSPDLRPSTTRIASQPTSSAQKPVDVATQTVAQRLIDPAQVLKEAKEGDINKMFFFGYGFDKGEFGFAPNRKEAKHWYKLSAARGHSFACYSLGELYAQKYNSLIAVRDALDPNRSTYNQEFDLLEAKIEKLGKKLCVYHEQAVRLGNARSAVILGHYYFVSAEFLDDPKERIKLYQASANKYRQALDEHHNNIKEIDRLKPHLIQQAELDLASLAAMGIKPEPIALAVPNYQMKNYAQIKEEIEKLKKIQQALTEDVGSLEEKKRGVEEKLRSSLQSYEELQQLKEHVDIKTAELNKKEKEMGEKEAEIKRENMRISRARRKLDEKQKEQELLHAELTAQLARDKEAKDDDKLAHTTQQLADSQAKIDALKEENKQLNIDIQRTRKMEADLKNAKLALERERKNFEAQRDEIEKKLSLKEVELEKQIQENQVAYNKQREMLAERIKAFGKLQADLDKQILDKEAMAAYKAEKKTEIEADIQRLKAEKKRQEKQARKARYESEIVEDKASRTAKLQEAYKKIKERNGELEREAGRVKGLEKRLKEAQEALKASEAQLSGSSKKWASNKNNASEF